MFLQKIYWSLYIEYARQLYTNTYQIYLSIHITNVINSYGHGIIDKLVIKIHEKEIFK